MNQQQFHLEALCDFFDDACGSPVPITAGHIDGLMGALRALGVTRVSWAYYADERGGHVVPCDPHSDNPSVQGFTRYTQTYRQLENPLRVAVEAGHRHGIQVYAYFKPYETGAGFSYPDGSPEAQAFGVQPKVGGKLVWFDPFVLDHPDLRIRRNTASDPDDQHTCPIATIKLHKTDDRPTRIRKENLQVWVSDDNYRYRRLDVDFSLTEAVEPAGAEVADLQRRVLTRAGDPIRTLTLTGLALTDPYVLVTTDLAEGDADFHNTAIDMMRVYDPGGRELVGVYANGSGIYNAELIDFRTWGLMFDHGYGCRASALDNSNASGDDGLIAFARGRSEYLDGALCETHPQVQEFWLDCVQAMIDAGADGVDFRIENHSTMTDFTEDYGYNQVVLDRLADPQRPAPGEIARIRGDAYTEFLGRARKLLSERERQMRINFQIDVLRPETPRHRLLAYPANVEFQWERWLDLGLADEAIFRFFSLGFDEALNEEVSGRILDRCQRLECPVVLNRYVKHGDVADEYRQTAGDPRFSGFILYETNDFVRYGEDGTCRISDEAVREVGRAHVTGG